MYRCQHTGENIGPNIPMFKVVTERRPVVYKKPIKRRKQIIDWIEVRGWETAKEIYVGPKAYEELTGEKAEFIPPPPEKKPAFKKQFRQRESERFKSQRDRRQRYSQGRNQGVRDSTSSRPQNRGVGVPRGNNSTTRR